jgi:hypothetical protein
MIVPVIVHNIIAPTVQILSLIYDSSKVKHKDHNGNATNLTLSKKWKVFII